MVKIKRCFDFAMAFIALLPLSFVMAVTALIVKFKLGSPIIFKQQRPGLNERTINVYKFRTMTNQHNPNGKLLPDNERLTNTGKMIRKLSSDELPQLFSVLKGDLSLVGPRPLLVEYLSLYTPEQARRHDVKPGITGWAQVNGRNGISWEKKFELDVWYVDNQSFWLDIKILFLTVFQLFKPVGINQENQATMKRFEGNSKEKVSTKWKS